MTARGAKPALADLVQSPDWLLAGVNFDQQTLSFARVEQTTYQTSSFLDHRIKPMPEEIFTVPARLIEYELDRMKAEQLQGPGEDTTGGEANGESVRPAGLILHTAFTGSTLLASCLGAYPELLVLKEPLVLSHLAKRIRESEDDRDHSLISASLSLLEKRYPGQHVIVKPSNYANALTPFWLDKQPDRSLLVLVGSLRRFLRSNLKKEQESRVAIPGFLSALSEDTDYWPHLDEISLDRLSWIQQCAALWHCQIVYFNRVLERAGSQVRTLDMEQWLAEPARVLELASLWLGKPIPAAVCSKIIQDGPFQKHSKKPDQAFSPDHYREEAESLEAGYSATLDDACRWAEERLISQLPVQFPLSNNLLD